MSAGDAAMADKELRQAVITACRALAQRGLSYGTSGNVSVRRDERRFFVSPTGMPQHHEPIMHAAADAARPTPPSGVADWAPASLGNGRSGQ